jgi:hypothetical protein
MKITKRQLRRIIREVTDLEDRKPYVNQFWKDNVPHFTGDSLGELEYARAKLEVELRYEEDANGDPWTPETVQFAIDEIQDELNHGSYYSKGSN